MRCLVTLLMSAGSVCGGLHAQSVSITDLPGIARARAERLRPVQEQALQPFWEDLALDYERNREYLDVRILEVVELGDSAVPLLLEKLDPADETKDQRQLAANCARVLAMLDPASFLEALLELTDDAGTEARAHAMTLLGETGSPRAVQALGDLLAELQRESDQVRAIEALTRLGDARVAAQVAPLLDSSAPVRAAALAYLNATGAATALDDVQQALARERDSSLLRGYIDYLGRVATADAAIAQSLLQLLRDGRLDRGDQVALCQALATVAPPDDEATVEALREILNAGQTGELGRAAAVTLYTIGDRRGADILYTKLDADVRRSRGDWQAYMERAELHFDLGMWLKAIADFRQAAKLSRRRETNTSCHLHIARCEARLGRWKNVLAALKDSGAQHSSILREAAQDPMLQEALDQEIVQRWLETLSR